MGNALIALGCAIMLVPLYIAFAFFAVTFLWAISPFFGLVMLIIVVGGPIVAIAGSVG